MKKLSCKECLQQYVEHDDDEGFGSGLCDWCFQDGVERAEERRRERIAQNNEH